MMNKYAGRSKFIRGGRECDVRRGFAASFFSMVPFCASPRKDGSGGGRAADKAERAPCVLERGIKKSLGRGRMILLEIIADPLAITIEAAICICVAPQPKFCLGGSY